MVVIAKVPPNCAGCISTRWFWESSKGVELDIIFRRDLFTIRNSTCNPLVMLLPHLQTFEKFFYLPSRQRKWGKSTQNLTKMFCSVRVSGNAVDESLAQDFSTWLAICLISSRVVFALLEGSIRAMMPPLCTWPVILWRSSTLRARFQGRRLQGTV